MHLNDIRPTYMYRYYTYRYYMQECECGGLRNGMTNRLYVVSITI